MTQPAADLCSGAFTGWAIADLPALLCAMNLLLDGIENPESVSLIPAPNRPSPRDRRRPPIRSHRIFPLKLSAKFARRCELARGDHVDEFSNVRLPVTKAIICRRYVKWEQVIDPGRFTSAVFDGIPITGNELTVGF